MGWAVLVPILAALRLIITRQLKHVHFSILCFWIAMGGLVVAVVGMLGFDHSTHTFLQWSTSEWMLSLLAGMVGVGGSMVMTKATCYLTPSKVMVVRSFEVVAAYTLQATVFDTPTHPSDVGGALLVILAVLFMGLEDMIMRLIKCRFI